MLPVLLRHWRMMLLLSATGIATYNTMSYIGLTSTTALNVLLLQSAGPLIIIVWAFALFGERPTLWQIRRRAAVAGRRRGHRGARLARDAAAPARSTAATSGSWSRMVIYGIYAAMFRRRPAAHPMSFLVATMGIGSMMILPFYLWEIAAGRPHRRAACRPGSRWPTSRCSRRSSPICSSTAASN